MVLFVLLPFAVAAVVIPFVAWTWRKQPKPVLTSEILANGVRAEADVLAVRILGGPLDVKPMVRFSLRVTAPGDGDPFEMEVVQSLPRALIREVRPGDRVEVRLTEDHSAGAVVVSAY